MDLEYFFAGTQSKEETSSAILATLLRHDDAFRTLFMSEVKCFPALDPSADWTIRVEDHRTGFRRFDVTLQTDAITVVIENKLSPNARRAGQLLEYYGASLGEWPTHRLVALYLAPESSWGKQQVEDVRHAMADRPMIAAAGSDWAQAMSWTEIGGMIGRLPEPVSWFAQSGIAAIEDAIKRAAGRTDRDWTPYQFLEAAATRGPSAVLVVQRSLDWLSARALQPVFGRGGTGPMYLALPRRHGDHDLVKVVKVYAPEGSINLSYWKIKTAAPFDKVDRRVELIHRLNTIPGATPIRDEYATESESSYISNEVLAIPGALDAFFGVMDWVAETILAGNNLDRGST